MREHAKLEAKLEAGEAELEWTGAARPGQEYDCTSHRRAPVPQRRGASITSPRRARPMPPRRAQSWPDPRTATRPGPLDPSHTMDGGGFLWEGRLRRRYTAAPLTFYEYGMCRRAALPWALESPLGGGPGRPRSPDVVAGERPSKAAHLI
jgi:hypothetical protein